MTAAEKHEMSEPTDDQPAPPAEPAPEPLPPPTGPVADIMYELGEPDPDAAWVANDIEIEAPGDE
jgi:hypothetical protein